jgi:hypothetical protein
MIMAFDLTGLGSIAELAKSCVNLIWPPDADPTAKMQAQMKLQELIEERENKIIDAQREIMVAEMNQGDNYTKRARPTVVYGGLLVIFLNNMALPWIAHFMSQTIPQITLPSEFWWAWGGCVSVWMIGRTAERRGANDKIVSMITGNKNDK